MSNFLDNARQEWLEKKARVERFLDKNRHGVSSAKAGAVSTPITAAPIVIGYLAKPEEFVNFMTHHIDAAIGIGMVAVAIIALTMYFAYQRSKKQNPLEDLSYYYSSVPGDGEEVSGEENNTVAPGLPLSTSSPNTQSPSFVVNN